jgi:hypothetical protein
VLDELRDHGAHHSPPVRRILAQLAEVSPVLHPPTRASAPLVLAGNLNRLAWTVHTPQS